MALSLLHHEYEAECRANQKIPYSYRSFARHYSNYADKYKATLRIRREPGEIMEVDWAGSTTFILDRDTDLYITMILNEALLDKQQKE